MCRCVLLVHASTQINYDCYYLHQQNVIPGFVATAMTGLKPNFLVPSGETYARLAIATIGVEKDTYGFWFHALMVHV